MYYSTFNFGLRDIYNTLRTSLSCYRLCAQKSWNGPGANITVQIGPGANITMQFLLLNP